MSTRFRSTVFVTVVATLSLLLLGCPRREQEQSPATKKPAAPRAPLRVGIATWPGFAPGYIALEKGYFGDLPVEFSIIDDFPARQAAFAGGKTDLTIHTLDSLSFDAGHGVAGKVLLVLDQSNGADAIVAKNAIRNAQQLNGRRIAYTRGSPSHYFLIAYLRKHGMSSANIKPLEVDDPGRAGEAFVSGGVDAAVTWEPNITQIVSTGKGHVLESTRTAPGLIIDVMVARNDVVTKRADDLQRFVDAWLRAVDYIKADPRNAHAIMARYLKIPAAEFPDMAAGLLYADIAKNRAILLPPEQSEAIRILADANDVWVGEKLITKPVDPKELVAPQFIARVQ